MQKDLANYFIHQCTVKLQNNDFCIVIISGVLSVEDQHTEIANATALSKAIKDLKKRIEAIRQQTDSISCSDRSRKICNLNFKKLSLENINVDEEYVSCLLHLNTFNL